MPAIPADFSPGARSICGLRPLTRNICAPFRGGPRVALARALHSLLAMPANVTIRPSDSIRQVLAQHPQLGAVFARHGMGGCGGAAGPDEPIDRFAALHRVELSALLDELNRALASPAPPPATEPRRAADEGLYRRFVIAALVCTLTLGATFGAYNLASIHLALGPIPPPHNWAHATFQLFGFVLLFVMGVGYHAVPRFWSTELALPGLARASFWLILAGILFRCYGQFGSVLPATAAAYRLGATALLAGTIAFAVALGASYWRGKPPFEPFHLFLGTGTAWWIVAASFAFAGNAQHERLYLAALMGGAVTWIEGMLLRVGPGLLGLARSRARWIWLSLPLGVVGTALCVVGSRLLPVGLLIVVAQAVVFATGARLLERRVFAQTGPAGDPGLGLAAILATVAWALFCVLAGAWAVLELAGRNTPALLWDGARHALALGFITMLIFGVAGRVLPVFGGAPLVWPRLRMAGLWTIGAGILLREAEVVASLANAPRLLVISGVSGIVAASGVALAATSILATVRGRREEVSGPVAIEPDVNVAALLRAHPKALEVLIAAGFAPLANPIARRTLAHGISLRTACRLHGVDVDDLVARLQGACQPTVPTDRPSPVVPATRLLSRVRAPQS
jgi:hypothetical protein